MKVNLIVITHYDRKYELSKLNLVIIIYFVYEYYFLWELELELYILKM